MQKHSHSKFMQPGAASMLPGMNTASLAQTQKKTYSKFMRPGA
jgi:hypothetical protein